MNAMFHSSMMNIEHTMSPTEMLAALQKSYGQLHSFWILSIFSYDICVGHWLADLGSTHEAHLKYNIEMYNNEYIFNLK